MERTIYFAKFMKDLSKRFGINFRLIRSTSAPLTVSMLYKLTWLSSKSQSDKVRSRVIKKWTGVLTQLVQGLKVSQVLAGDSDLHVGRG